MSGWRTTWGQDASALGIPTPLLKFLMPNRCLNQLFAISYNFPKEELCYKCKAKIMFQKLRSQNTPTFEVITFRVQINSTIEKKSIIRCTAEIHNINTKRKLNRLVFEYNQNIQIWKNDP